MFSSLLNSLCKSDHTHKKNWQCLYFLCQEVSDETVIAAKTGDAKRQSSTPLDLCLEIVYYLSWGKKCWGHLIDNLQIGSGVIGWKACHRQQLTFNGPNWELTHHGDHLCSWTPDTLCFYATLFTYCHPKTIKIPSVSHATGWNNPTNMAK